jgi:PD-(D/E)XK nuclease superfamily protein
MTTKPDDSTLNETKLEEIVDITPTKKNVILDSQVLSTLMSCGRLTDFRFNHNLVSLGGKSTSLEMGSIVHTVLESYYKNIIKGISRHDSIGTAITAGLEYIEKSGEVTNISSEDKELVFNTLDQYWDFYKNDYWVPIEVEIVKGDVIYEDDEIRVIWKAKLDLTMDTNQVGIVPVDHKTMKQRRDTLTLNNQFMGQCTLMKTSTMFVNKIGFQTSLKPMDKFLRVAIPYTNERLIEWQSEIVPYWAYKLLEYSETGYWPPNFTHCENKYGFCGFKGICESNPEMREEELKINFKVGEKWDISNDD